nr:hypothetical protein [Tanacetum cinerariifolium]
MVVEGEVLKDFSKFFGILIAEFVTGGTVNRVLKMKGDMIIKDLNLKPTIDAMMREFLDPFRWKELSKETSSKILPCGDGSYWKTFKPIAKVCGMNIRFAPTGWCQIEEVPRCSLRGAR